MTFPRNFLWGVSSSGFQFEMGNPAGEGIDRNTDWFLWVHDRYNIEKKIVSGDLPENGPDYWHLYEKDHQLAKDMGLNSYRLGIEWSRIFPTPTKEIKVDVEKNEFKRISNISAKENFLEKMDEIADKAALNHYKKMILDIIDKGMKPIICLNHFTLPLWVHQPINVRNSKGRFGPKGWIDEETIVEFWKYTAYIAWKLGDIIDFLVTFNEPNIVAETGYLFPEMGFPPGLNNFRLFRKCLCNLVIAHARAYDVIKQFNKVSKVGIILNIVPMEPYNKEKDLNACNVSSHIHNLFFIEAVLNGWIDENLNCKIDRGEKDSSVGNKVDWIGINYYTRNVIKGRRSILAKLFAGIPTIPEIVRGYGNNCKPNDFSNDGKPTSDFGWEIYPTGLLHALELMKKYDKPLYITENGIADFEDKLRPNFIVEHLKVLEDAIAKEKIDVRGYFHWSLTDNYEWAQGFRMRFGLYYVDFKTKERKARKSCEVYKKIVSANTTFD
ncbi:MAG: beta-galactosidase BgaS [Nitrososphaeria archaeon]|nr:beta-galactosidase BgaS [Nitrososphaeria archaeon]